MSAALALLAMASCEPAASSYGYFYEFSVVALKACLDDGRTPVQTSPGHADAYIESTTVVEANIRGGLQLSVSYGEDGFSCSYYLNAGMMLSDHEWFSDSSGGPCDCPDCPNDDLPRALTGYHYLTLGAQLTLRSVRLPELHRYWPTFTIVPSLVDDPDGFSLVREVDSCLPGEIVRMDLIPDDNGEQG